ncbi:NADH-dependent flavin oxidoreductase [Pediococcus siamensis]|uniref:NADH-dependent flavin oxidoreductase n=1 Tax=Pediococcus siamensis TaxID=381829 RepID=UPI0039A1DD7F
MASYNFLEPYTFANGATVRNRIVMPPMTECSAFENGVVSNDEIAYYRKRAGGVGLEITGCANVSELGKGFEGELAVTEDRDIPQLAHLAAAIKSRGAKAILQIFDAGRMTTSAILRGEQPVSASAVKALRENSETPRALSEDEVEAIIKDFGAATKRAIQAGFDGVEIHGANTYLIQQFFSPHSNRRRDQWGGSLDQRMNFPLGVVEEVRRVVKENAPQSFLVGYRISPEEIETPGIRIADTLALVPKLIESGIDYLHISLKQVWQTSANDETDTEPLVEKIQKVVAHKVPLIVVGQIVKPADAEKVIDAGFEFAALGQELIREPNWVQKVMADDEATIRYELSPSDLDELNINPPLWDFLNSGFKKTIHFSHD